MHIIIVSPTFGLQLICQTYMFLKSRLFFIVVIFSFVKLPVWGQMSNVATNQCISLNKPVYCNQTALNWSSYSALSDGDDGTTLEVASPVTIALQVDAQTSTTDSLILHWRAKSWDNRDVNTASLKHYEIYTSHNSTNGVNGDWTFIQEGYSHYKDNFVFFPNNQPKWVQVRELDSDTLKLARLEVFQNAPAGKKNDIWMFYGDSQTLGAMGTGDTNYQAATRFGNQIHADHPCYYPIVLNMGKGGERATQAYVDLEQILDDLPQISFVTLAYGINDVIFSVPPLVPYDDPANDVNTSIFLAAYATMINTCNDRGILPIPARIPWVHFPNDYSSYEDTTADHTNGITPINLHEMDSLIAQYTPYAIDTSLGIPYADFDTWFREHGDEDEVFQEDHVHLYRRGINQFNKIWVHTAEAIIYDNTNCDTTGNLTITCPENIYKILADSISEVAVSWDSPFASSTCGLGPSVLLTQVEGPEMDSLLGVGNYYVAYETTDNCGQSKMCRFSITIQPPHIPFDCGEVDGFSKIGELNNHGYYLSENIANWKNARDTATMLGGYLATVSSQTENDLLQAALNQETAFIGIYDFLEEGSPEWANGEPVTFDLSFDNSEANDFGLINFWAGTWGLVNEWITKKYILEKGCDILDLTMTCPSDITIQLPVGQTDTAFIWELPTAETLCDSSGDVSLSQLSGEPNGALLSAGSYSYTWTAVDSCQNSASCFWVIVVDSTPIAGDLSINCPSAINIVLPVGQSDIVLDWTSPVASTTCNVSANISLSQIGGPVAGSAIPVGTTDITYVATDSCQNSDTCTFQIVVDSTPIAGDLSINCPSAINIDLPVGQSDIVLDWTPRVASTTCNVSADILLSQIGGPVAGSAIPVGTTDITYVAMDSCQNSDTCTFQIVVDSTPIAGDLSINCPNDISIELPIGQTDTIFNWEIPVANTTCNVNSGISLTQIAGSTSGSALPLGTSLVSYMAIDSCGNSDTCSFSIHITPEPDALHKPTNSPKLKIIPNPVNKTLRIEFDAPKVGKATVRIFSGEGVLVSSRQVTLGKDEISLDVSKIKQGAYYVQFISSDFNYWGRFVKI
ncbi:MAG TPA: HYR domain-containing protein [Saprospiraceae bacterium]|nr:HYR domain-containing protein [Saprospiraceae bacterium]